MVTRPGIACATVSLAVTFGDMLILQLRAGKVNFTGQPPSYPARVVVQGRLLPREIFASRPRSGRLPIVLPGEQVQLRYDPTTGDTLVDVSGAIGRLRFDVHVQGCEVSLDGDVATLTIADCPSEQRFFEAVEFVRQALPAYLSAAVPAPVSIHSIDGAVGQAPFELVLPSITDLAFLTADAGSLSEAMADYLRDVDRIAGDSLRLTAAHRYLMQARWLRYASPSTAMFLGERILNLAKALEVLWPGENHIDLMRKALRGLGVDAKVTELLASVAFLRDQLDVGHPALSTLSESEHSDAIQRVTLMAEDALAGLLRLLTKEIGAKKYALDPRSVSPNIKTDRRRTLELLKANEDFTIQPYGSNGSLQPRPVQRR